MAATELCKFICSDSCVFWRANARQTPAENEGFSLSFFPLKQLCLPSDGENKKQQGEGRKNKLWKESVVSS